MCVCVFVNVMALPNPSGPSHKPKASMARSLALNSNFLASIHGYTSVILNHTKRKSSEFPAGFALCGPSPSPHPPHIGWHRNTSWPEDGNSDDVTEDHG